MEKALLKIKEKYEQEKDVKIKELALTEKQLKRIKKWMEEKIEETFVNINSDSTYCNFAYNWTKD